MLKLWKSGFSLDSGELRSYQDPSNAQFLDDIRRGYVVRGVRTNSCFLKQAFMELRMLNQWHISAELFRKSWILSMETMGGQT